MSQSSPSQQTERQYRYDLHTPLTIRYTRERPTGVTVLAVLYFIGAGLFQRTLFPIILSLVTAPDPAPGERVYSDVDMELWFTGTPAALGLALTLVTGIGLWLLKSWGRVVALSICGVIIAVAVMGSWGNLYASAIVTILVSGTVFYYLCSPKVSKAFTD